MKFLNYTFEQSQSLVTKDTVEKLNQKRSWKRFIGLFITSIVIYFFSIITPMFIKGLTLDQNPTFSWIQWPMILFYVVMYLVYLFFSIKHRRSPMKLKFCTYFYMGSLTRYLYSMCWYNDDDTTKYCQHIIGCYVSSFHLILDSNGSP